MTDLSEAAEILKRAKLQQKARRVSVTKKPGAVMAVNVGTMPDPAPNQPAFYSLTAPSGKLVRMTGDPTEVNPKAMPIAE